MPIARPRPRRPLVPLALAAATVSCATVASATTDVDTLYWPDRGTGRIQALPLDGGAVRTVVALNDPRGVHYDARPGQAWLYWTDLATGTVGRIRADGSGFDLVVASGDMPSGVTVDPLNDRVVWTDLGDNTLRSTTFDGTDVDVLATATEPMWGVTFSACDGMIYWAQNETIRRVAPDGTGAETVIDAGTRIRDVLVDPTDCRLYWCENEMIRSSALDGSDQQDFEPGSRIWGLALDVRNRVLYWSDVDTDEITRRSLDGGPVEVVVGSGLTDVRSVSLGTSNVPPNVVAGPTSILVDAPDSVELTVVATGTELAYQWRRDGVELTDGDGVSGSQTDTLTVMADLDDEGYYDCVVTNALGLETSEPAVLGVRSCPGDVDGDGLVDVQDLLSLLAAWGPCT